MTPRKRSYRPAGRGREGEGKNQRDMDDVKGDRRESKGGFGRWENRQMLGERKKEDSNGGDMGDRKREREREGREEGRLAKA